MNLTEKDIIRFWSKVSKRKPDQCWFWLGGTDDYGYGTIRIGNKIQLAHRVSFFLHNGWILKCALHKCDTPLCVNPYHLFSGTRADNACDRKSKGRGANVNGEKNPRAKLTLLDVLEMRRLRAIGETTRNLVTRYGVSRSTIKYALNGTTWNK